MSLLDGTLREQAAAVAGGDADPAELLDAALARIEERNPSVNAIVETFPERVATDARRGPARSAVRGAGGDQGRVAAAVAGGAAGGRRARRTCPEARRVRPLPGASRRRGGDRRGGEHARVRRRQHGPHLRLRPGPQPLGHRPLPRGLVERSRRRRRRPAGQRRGGRRRRRLDPLPGGLLRAHRAEADLRPLGHARPPRRRRRRRSSPGRCAATPPTAACWAASCSARSWRPASRTDCGSASSPGSCGTTATRR